jgi:hypothetical protein
VFGIPINVNKVNNPIKIALKTKLSVNQLQYSIYASGVCVIIIFFILMYLVRYVHGSSARFVCCMLCLSKNE